MLLAVDIGNTNINFGIFKGSKITKKFNIPTGDYSRHKLTRKLNKCGFSDAIICSVVPKVTKALSRDLKKILDCQPCVIGEDIKVPMRNLYRKPKQVGQDRLVNAYAAVTLYGAPLVVVDFGTAVTFDIVSGKKEYLGGMILPGLEISLDVLAQRTALLPKVKLSEPAEFIGRDTESSMLSGIVYGFAVLTDELAQKIKNKLGKNAKVIGTGGNIGLIEKYCQGIDKIDQDLTLKGLRLINKIFINKNFP